MFDPQKAPPAPKPTAPEINIDPNLIPIRTMKGDLEALAGQGKVVINSDSPEPAQGILAPFEGKAVLSGKSVATPVSPFSDVAASPFLSDPGEAEPEAASEDLPVYGSRPAQVEDFFRPAAPEEASEEAPEQSGGMGKAFLVVIGAVILLAVAGGGYYFYMTRYNVPEEEPVVIAPPVVEPPREEPVRTEKFSTSRANPLPIDVESINAAGAKELFSSTIAEMKADGKAVPVEFVVTDANNNPVSFRIFAKVIGLTPSVKLLSLLKDDFSVFLYFDGGKNRMAIAVEPTDPTTIMGVLKGEERTMVKSLGTLLMGEESLVGGKGAFSDGSYAGTVIRYQNLNSSNDLSVDYFQKGALIYFATSKNLGRAILDKLNREAAGGL